MRKPARPYTAEEDAFIRQHYPTKRIKWIAAQLDRDRGSITYRAGWIGLEKRHRGDKALQPKIRERAEPWLPPAGHPAIREPSSISPPTLAQLMAGSANPRPRVYIIEA